MILKMFLCKRILQSERKHSYKELISGKVRAKRGFAKIWGMAQKQI
jgi:hypothetical protein